MKDYYDIIGVPKNASKKEIEERYQFLAQAFHPDKFEDATQKAKAEKDFAAIEEAYQVLSDKTRRADYDRYAADKSGVVVEEAQKPKNRTWLYVVGGVVVLLLIVGAGLAGRFLPIGNQNTANATLPAAASDGSTPSATTAVPEIVGARPGECLPASSIFPPEKTDYAAKLPPISSNDYSKGPADALMTIIEYSDFT
jgi:curved DNA-binding protein CbpA